MLVNFFRTLVTHEDENKMTTYNVAVTVGPNIMRPFKHTQDDIVSAGVHYDAFMRMISQYQYFFEDKELLAETNLNDGALGGI